MNRRSSISECHIKRAAYYLWLTHGTPILLQTEGVVKLTAYARLDTVLARQYHRFTGHALVTAAIAEAATVSIATPIYNYGVGGATRNLIALTGKAWTEKVVGFLCAAGGQGSYMAVMAVANSLMLDFRSLIVPRFVYASGACFSEDRITDATIEQRIDGLASDLRRIGSAITQVVQ
ncbi:MAG: NAD(P)H-dependent oxidoreductase [Chloroflexi bacterium]|nr:NAD(P)H-dependent oxidoreductase [Chloroflexota bacterium]